MDPDYRLTTYLDQMRKKYQVTPRGSKLYIAKLDDAIVNSEAYGFVGDGNGDDYVFERNK